MAAMSLATDITMGQPMEDGLAVCLLATRVAEELGLPDPERERVFYTAANAERRYLARRPGDAAGSSPPWRRQPLCRSQRRGAARGSAEMNETEEAEADAQAEELTATIEAL